jgi:hypothetical protein
MKKNKRFGWGALALTFIVTVAACGGRTSTASSSENPLVVLKQAADTMKAAVSPAADAAADAMQASLDAAGTEVNTQWNEALDTYEKFVDEYTAFMKKYNANPGDTSLLTQYASMMEEAQKAADTISAVEANLSGADLLAFSARYSKMAAKMAAALQ